MDFNIVPKPIDNISKTELKEIKGIIIDCPPQFYDLTAKWGGQNEISKLNKDTKDYGYHYTFDMYETVELVNPKLQINPFRSNTSTYISTALYKQKPQENCISVCLFLDTEHDYEVTEKRFVRFLVKLLRDNKLESKDIWRSFDLSKSEYGPFHILDKKLFDAYLKEIDKYLDVTDDKLSEKEQDKKDDEVKFVSPFKKLASESKDEEMTIEEYIKKFYEENKDKAEAYAKKFQPWDKDLDEIKNAEQDVTVGELTTKEYPTGNKLQFKINQKAPLGSCDCSKATDQLDGIQTSKETMVEPIYPDLITPPGGEIHIANGSSDTATQSSSNTIVSVEEFERRQKTFSMDNFDDVKKTTVGRPINCEDPFPVDAQIKKLEEHFPKVKVDNIKFDYTDCNHLGSEVGASLSKNANMMYDVITEVSKRTEQRLVKIENNLSTVMRNLFRMSARVHINCVYYGGQSVYGKYNCIRCLKDDRVNDGAIVSLDQCLCCTRYEPVVGQVYAILDEAGTNVVQVMDDMQMAYQSLDQYKELNTVGLMHDDMNYANLKEDSSETPKPFIENKWKDTEEEMKAKNVEVPKSDEQYDSEDNIDEEKKESEEEEKKKKAYVNGFKMNWTPDLLETHAPAINEYKVEMKEVTKHEPESENQKIDRDVFIDSREKAVEYEKLEFDIKDYTISEFGSSSSGSLGSDGLFGLGASEVRDKIVKYALDAVELCKQGKAQYSQNNRYNHGDQAINGINYWDCSSLVQRAYEAAGITGIGTSTHSQYPYCLDKNGGILFPISNIDEALPGDMVWFKTPPQPTDKAGLQNVPYGDGNIVHHIAIYIGNNQYAHASQHNPSDPTKDLKVSTLGYYDHEMCFGRVKKLIDLDKQASQGLSGSDAWSKEKQGISEELWNAAKVADSNVSGMIANMEKYGYRDVLIKQAKAHKYDPYFVAAIIAIESTGNPMTGGNYPGIMQSSSGYATSTLSGIEDNIDKGLNDLSNKASWLKQKGWTESNMHLLATAHNCGQYGTTDALGHSNETRPDVAIPMMGKVVNLNTCKIPEVAQTVYDYTRTYQRSWSAEEKRTYATKVLRAYNLLYSKKVLG